MQRTFVTFDASFEDDGEFYESGDIRRPGGHNIAREIADFLRQLGLEVEGPEQHSYYGWSVFGSGKKRHWLLLQGGASPWLLTCEEQHLFRAKNSITISPSELVERLHNWLLSEDRFRAVRWYTGEEYERNEKGAPAPN